MRKRNCGRDRTTQDIIPGKVPPGAKQFLMFLCDGKILWQGPLHGGRYPARITSEGPPSRFDDGIDGGRRIPLKYNAWRSDCQETDVDGVVRGNRGSLINESPGERELPPAALPALMTCVVHCPNSPTPLLCTDEVKSIACGPEV
jgi:hypothetical protein